MRIFKTEMFFKESHPACKQPSVVSKEYRLHQFCANVRPGNVSYFIRNRVEIDELKSYSAILFHILFPLTFFIAQLGIESHITRFFWRYPSSNHEILHFIKFPNFYFYSHFYYLYIIVFLLCHSRDWKKFTNK